MNNDGLNKLATLQLPIGHLLVVWDVLANKIPDTNYKNIFAEEEKIAIWALEDICENELEKNGFGARPKEQWDQLMEQATVFVKSIPTGFAK